MRLTRQKDKTRFQTVGMWTLPSPLSLGILIVVSSARPVNNNSNSECLSVSRPRPPPKEQSVFITLEMFLEPV